MRKLILVIGFIMLLFIGCGNSKDNVNKDSDGKESITQNRVTIRTDVTGYSPLMSSIRGITLTPEFEPDQDYEKVVYHWVTDKGEFIDLGQEVKNQGEPVVWTILYEGSEPEPEDTVHITLEVLEGDSDKVLAETGLTMTSENGFYIINE